MADQKLKVEMIHSIEQLQLSHQLIHALDDAQQAETVVTAVNCLKHFTEQWH
ncbi:hypothetical protein [Acinetobacter wuhouensis]|uniref:hypothetical protein n=1 Tax=Acinetobacter wuhouensis TaxID=1879050 RepID=UPI0013CE66BF|nr:hypothetical protein [Acinetobacter wuhouensis]